MTSSPQPSERVALTRTQLSAGDRSPQRTKDILLHVLRKRGVTSANELAEVLDISVQATRRHLRNLEEDGLIEHERVSVGAGRPQHVYRLTDKGAEYFPRHYDEFALTFLTALAEQMGPEAVERVLHAQWQQKAANYRQRVGDGGLRDRIAKLAELRTEEGYMVDWHPLVLDPNEGSSARYIFAEYNCAIGQIAESFPTVCNHELEMLAAIFPDCTVERTHWMVGNEHRCGYQIDAV
ncbi:MAG: iron-sulfur cluster biosynthesis transcriptional regulator SufR [Cyanobacteria bacterium J06642_2]